MAAMVKRLSHGLVVPVLRVRFPLAAPHKNPSLTEGFLCGAANTDDKTSGSMRE
jgi:hypothetical protein